MARLHVEACTAERTAGDVAQRLLVGVSVSVVESGVPVTGLANENFRLTPVSVGGDLVIASRDLAVLAAREGYWEPDGVELAGCYQLEIGYTRPPLAFRQGNRYVLGIQCQTFTNAVPPQVADCGQTVIELISLGV
jgi:hypothetical protein